MAPVHGQSHQAALGEAQKRRLPSLGEIRSGQRQIHRQKQTLRYQGEGFLGRR